MKQKISKKFLEKSDSYNFYKKNYENLLNENKKLEDILKQYKTVYPPKKCPVCGYEGIDFIPYPQIIHREVECPNCHSHERHRAMWLYLHEHEELVKKGNRVLHFAAELPIFNYFKSKDIEYYPVDIMPQEKLVEKIVDIQDIPFPDDYFDLIYCSNVLEHVENDMKAINELYRVLKPGGTALILVPINGISFEIGFDTSKTVENPEYNTPELREKYYGQDDHFRLYGTDFTDRLEKVGFKIKADNYIKKLGYEKVEKYALIRDENIFECTK